MTQPDVKPTTVRVLVIAHDAALSELISESFTAYDPVFKVSTVVSMQDAAKSIEACSPDVVVVSNRMPKDNGYSMLVANGRSENYPLIVVAETEEIEDAVSAMKAGASDYVVMSGYNVATLPLTVTRVVSEWQRLVIERREREFDRRTAQIVESLPELVGMADNRGRILYVNSAGREMIGASLDDDLTDTRIHDIFPDWTVGAVVQDGPAARVKVPWRKNARMLGRSGEERNIDHAVVAHVSSKLDVQFYTIVARDCISRHNS